MEPSPSVLPMAPQISESVRAPRVFISYAHDSDAHREQARDLLIVLRAHGVESGLSRHAAARGKRPVVANTTSIGRAGWLVLVLAVLN
jgi:hypothetical protein